MENTYGSYKAVLGKGGLQRTWGGVCWILGLVFAILGVIGEAMNATLGLGSSTWLLLAIAAFAASISWYLGWAVALYFDALEAKNKKE